MEFRNIFKKATIFLIFCASLFFIGPKGALAQTKETIIYDVNPFGISVYEDSGVVELKGKKVNLVVFKTQVLGFHDTETIYSDAQNYLPLWVERDITIWGNKEYLTEEYIPKSGQVNIAKFKEGKKIDEYHFKADGPIHNAILLPFSLRKEKDLKVGWSCVIRLPEEFKVKLVSIEKIKVPAGRFMAYHFTSTPHKFEVWITADQLRLPIKIKGVGILSSYVLVMRKYIR